MTNEKLKILIVDDEQRMRKLIGDFLTANGYLIVEAEDGEAALKAFYSDNTISLVILDVMMPKMNGWEVLKAMRNDSSIPIIMLTARSEENDEVSGFQSGADDYITKPFSPKILIARVNSILRRNKKESSEIMDIGGIKIDKIQHQVYVDDDPIELSFKEFELLDFLMENKDIALTREKILNSVWNFDYFGDARTIDTHIKKLRAKLKSKGDYIKTIWGMGYKFKID
ncbi:MAG: response regulator transcription factor [Eubacteriales bacterium]|nr:response regulator transcription factor [Eubacteriales bacterium]